MRGSGRDAIFVLAWVLASSFAGWQMARHPNGDWPYTVGACLFFVALAMVASGLRLLIEPVPEQSKQKPEKVQFEAPEVPEEFERHLPPDYLLGGGPLDAPISQRSPYPEASSEIIHIELSSGCARVVALLRVGEGPDDMHLLELDVMGTDLRPEVIAEAVEEVASGEPASGENAPVERVGYAAGWGLTLPCPPLTH